MREQHDAAVSSVLTRSPQVSAFPLDDELVLFDPGSGQSYVLNATAARIWEWCDGSRTLALLARALATSYALDEEQALADVGELIEGFRRAGLLHDG